MSRYPAEGNPWADFLNARARVLASWRDDGKSVDQMVRDLVTDLGAVRLILMTVDQHPEEYRREARNHDKGCECQRCRVKREEPEGDQGEDLNHCGGCGAPCGVWREDRMLTAADPCAWVREPGIWTFDCRKDRS